MTSCQINMRISSLSCVSEGNQFAVFYVKRCSQRRNTSTTCCLGENEPVALFSGLEKRVTQHLLCLPGVQNPKKCRKSGICGRMQKILVLSWGHIEAISWGQVSHLVLQVWMCDLESGDLDSDSGSTVCRIWGLRWIIWPPWCRVSSSVKGG